MITITIPRCDCPGCRPVPTPAAIKVRPRKPAEPPAVRYEKARRAAACKNGYRGPLTRAEASAAQLAKLAGR